MSVNLQNIFSFQTTKPETFVDNTQSDDVRTNELKTLLSVFDFGLKKTQNFFLLSQKEGLFKIAENGDLKTKARLSNHQNCRLLQQTDSFFAFLSEGNLVVFEKWSLQEESPLVYLELTLSSLLSFKISETLLAIDTRSHAILIDLRKKILLFKEKQVLEEKCKVKSRPLICQGDKAFFHFPRGNQIQRYTLGKDYWDKKEERKENTSLAESLENDAYLHQSVRLDEEISLPKGFRATSAHLTFENGLLLFLMSKRLLLVLSEFLKPEGEYLLQDEEIHEAQIKLSKDKQKALVLLTNYFDESLKSYYGLNFLFLLDLTAGQPIRVKTITGPIHNILWSQNSEEFIVFSGHMPAHVLFYNRFGEPKLELGIMYANFGKFSPDQKYLVLGASGNLSGNMLIYDNIALKLSAEVKSPSGSKFKWMADSQRFELATCQDRLKVDNCLTLHGVSGKCLMRVDCSESQLNETLFIQNCFSQTALEYNDNSFVEKPKKEKRVLTQRIIDNVISGLKKESREVRYISNQYIDETNLDIARMQLVKDEEAKLHQKKHKKVGNVVLTKGENFGLSRVPKVILEEYEGEDKEQPKNGKRKKKKSKETPNEEKEDKLEEIRTKI